MVANRDVSNIWDHLQMIFLVLCNKLHDQKSKKKKKRDKSSVYISCSSGFRVDLLFVTMI